MDYNIIILSISTLRKQVDKCVGRWGDKKITYYSQLEPVSRMLIEEKGNIDEHMMYNTYNMGVGMCLAIDPTDADKTIAAIESAGDKAFVLGTVVAGEKGVDLC